MKATKTLAAAALLAAGTQANAAITDFTISLEAELKASGAIITTGTGIGQYDDVSGIFTMTSLTEFTEGAAVNPGTLAGFDITAITNGTINTNDLSGIYQATSCAGTGDFVFCGSDQLNPLNEDKGTDPTGGANGIVEWLSIAIPGGIDTTIGNMSTITIDAGSTIRTYTLTAVPVPAAVWLMGSSLLGLVSFGRKRLG